MSLFINRVGEIGYNTRGTKMEIIECYNAKKIIVEFKDKEKLKITTNYYNFKKGEVRNPFDKSAYDIGYLGVGDFKSCINNNDTAEYTIWKCMLRRCYDPKYHKSHKAYIGCTVDHEWHNFQNFAKWYNDNFYKIPGEKMELDKDILVNGNKTYGPDTCVFVPKRINSIVIKTARSYHHIKQVAEKYRDKIPDKLYQALLNYKVKITD